MKKSDLKTGMTVEYSEGGLAKVLINTERGNILVSPDDTWTNIDSYNDNLERIDNVNELTIVKVFSLTSAHKGLQFGTSKLLWERQETPEYTIEQLIEKVGHKFKIKK